MTTTSLATGRKADYAIGFFKLLIAIACLSLLVVFLDERIMRRAATEDFDSWLWACNAIMTVLYLAAGGFYMFWFYALYKQLYSESPHILRVPPVWTVLGFSFPIANLFLPYLLVVKAWRRLKEMNAPVSANLAAVVPDIPNYFKVWWLSHLICFFAVPAAYIMALTRLNSAESEVVQTALSVFAYVMVCISARFAIRLVRELNSYS
jgi:hypothetical protein